MKMGSEKELNWFSGPLFKRDPESKKMVPIPNLKTRSTSTTTTKTSNKKTKSALNILPLNITPADFEEFPNRPSKMRKVDNNSVRKELFNFPSKGTRMSRLTLNTRQTLKKNSVCKKAEQEKVNPYELSILLDMEEVEEELIKKNGFLKGYPFRTPTKPITTFTKLPKCTPIRENNTADEKNSFKIEINGTPKSSLSNELEFLEMEKMCDIEEQSNDKSPVSSVCNLLEGTIINSSKKDKKSIKTTASIHQDVRDITNILTESNIVFQNYKITHAQSISKITEILEEDKKLYQNVVTLQEKNNRVINNILNKLKYEFPGTSQIESDKENSPAHNRRSIRLLNKSPIHFKDSKRVGSPLMLKDGDLRKTTLKKNLVTKTQQHNVGSPRMTKALNMYNSMRSDISVLMTPKLDRESLSRTPMTANLTKNLSRRVQNQCLLLQDTPHK